VLLVKEVKEDLNGAWQLHHVYLVLAALASLGYCYFRHQPGAIEGSAAPLICEKLRCQGLAANDWPPSATKRIKRINMKGRFAYCWSCAHFSPLSVSGTVRLIYGCYTTIPSCNLLICHEKEYDPHKALFGRRVFLGFGVSYPAQFQSTGNPVWAVR
jgi:hypothetical protein